MRARCVAGVGLGLVVIGIAAAPARADGPPTERRLHLAAAEASSYLVSDWAKFQENYLPLYVGDDDPTTAWTEGVKGDGAGEWLRLRVTPMAGATRVRLRVRNGYQKTPKLFTANTRARAITVVLLPSGKTLETELADRQDWQELVIDQPAGAFEAVELRFKTFYSGTKYDDNCISDVQLYVTATTPENPAFEKARLDKLLAWKGERLAAARLFKSANAKNLPIASQYVIKEDEAQRERPFPAKACGKRPEHTCLVRTQLEDARADAVAKTSHGPLLDRAIAALKAGWGPWRPAKVVPTDSRRIPNVDGLCTIDLNSCNGDTCYQSLNLPSQGYLGFLQTSALAALEVKDPPSMDDVMNKKLKECHRHGAVTRWGWVLRGKASDSSPGPIQMLYLTSCGGVESREGFVSESDGQLLVYDDEGKLQIVAGRYYVTMYRWRTGATGPVIAGGRRTGGGGLPDLTAEEAVNVAGR
jgi:hypothetical protein